jgi:uncharacterized protein YjdB
MDGYMYTKRRLRRLAAAFVVFALSLAPALTSVSCSGGGDKGVTGVSVQHGLTITEGRSHRLDAAVAPPDAANKNVAWSSSAPGVAAVSSGGLVTAVAEGLATITVRTDDGGKTDACAVTVTPAVSGVSLGQTAMELYVGGTGQLTAALAPAGVSDADSGLVWTSGDPRVATVSGGGAVVAVNALAPGASIIAVASEADPSKTAACTVTVLVPVAGVELDKAALDLKPGDSEALAATVLPPTASNRAVVWSSNAPGVAEVSSGGLVTALAEGLAVITATTQDGGKTATCAVTVARSDVYLAGWEFGAGWLVFYATLWKTVSPGG